MTHRFYDQLTPIIGHRGACGHCPENTLVSFETAKKMGAEWIETDVSVTADGVAIVFHDDTLNRCTNSKGLLLNTPYEHIEKLDAGSWYSQEFMGEPIPTLEQLIDACERFQLKLNLEIKCPIGWEWETVEAIAPIIRDKWNPDWPLILSSFNKEALIAAKQLLPEYPRGLNTEAIPRRWQEQLEQYDCQSLHFYAPFVEEDKIRAIKAAGYRVLSYTVNDAAEGRGLIEMGVDAVFTDYPLYMGAALRHVQTPKPLEEASVPVAESA